MPGAGSADVPRGMHSGGQFARCRIPASRKGAGSGLPVNRTGGFPVSLSTMTLLRNHLVGLCGVAAFSANAVASPGTESLVTVILTEQYSVPGTVEKDSNGRPIYPAAAAYENEWARYDFQGNLIEDNYEYQERIATYKLSNREFLGFLVNAGVIPTIYGWSLKAIYNESSEIPTYYVTKPGAAPVYVGDYFDLATFGQAAAVNAVSTDRYSAAGNLISSVARDESTTKTDVLLTFSTQPFAGSEGTTMSLAGMWRHTLSLRPVRVGGTFENRYLNGPGSIYAISGTIDDTVSDGSGGFDNYQSIVEGSWIFGSGWPVLDLGFLYPEAEPLAP